jgi:hypothetical protein
MKKTIITLFLVLQYLVADSTLMIEVAYNHDSYSINKAWTVNKTYPATLENTTVDKSDIVIEIKDNTNKVIDTLRIENPNIIRGILSKNDDMEGHLNTTRNKGIFIVRYPYHDDLSALNIRPMIQSSKTIRSISQSKNLYFKHLLNEK